MSHYTEENERKAGRSIENVVGWLFRRYFRRLVFGLILLAIFLVLGGVSDLIDRIQNINPDTILRKSTPTPIVEYVYVTATPNPSPHDYLKHCIGNIDNCEYTITKLDSIEETKTNIINLRHEYPTLYSNIHSINIIVMSSICIQHVIDLDTGDYLYIGPCQDYMLITLPTEQTPSYFNNCDDDICIDTLPLGQSLTNYRDTIKAYYKDNLDLFGQYLVMAIDVRFEEDCWLYVFPLADNKYQDVYISCEGFEE